jgi:hypothetical protein
VLLDGYIVRQIKAKEFRQHDPELFALYCRSWSACCSAGRWGVFTGGGNHVMAAQTPPA